MRTLTHRRRAGLAALAALALGGGLLAVPAAASATPAPDAGPTSGGTVVSDIGVPGAAFVEIDWYNSGALAIDGEGTPWVWGYNSRGEFGNGTTDPSLVPTPAAFVMPAGVTKFTQISAGAYHTVAIGDDGNTYAWGQNTNGQLGNGGTDDSSVPVAVDMPLGVTFTKVVATTSGGFGFGDDGQLWGWGRDNYGQIGDNDNHHKLSPSLVVVPAGVTFTYLTAGADFTLAMGDDGQTYAWGRNDWGIVGDGSGVNRWAPVLVDVPAGVRFTQVSAGQNHALAVGDDGNAYAWGYNYEGQLGDGTTTRAFSPVVVTAPAGVTYTRVVGGYQHSFGFGSDGNLYAWGLNNRGVFGNGTTTGGPVPVLVPWPAGVTFTEIVAHFNHVFAIGSDGNTYTWGYGVRGALGDGTTIEQRNSPEAISAIEVTGVSFGGVAGRNFQTSGSAPALASWSATTPPGCGPVDVVVSYTQFGIAREATIVDGFTYGAAPTVVSASPAAQEVERGGRFRVTATADGDDASSFQWQEQLEDGSWAELAGETSATLTIDGVQETGVYRVVAQNCWGADAAVISEPVVFTVVEPAVTPPTEPPGGGNGGGAGNGGGTGTGADTGGGAGTGTPGDAGTPGAATGKGSGNELWLAGTGNDLLWLGVALATAATVCGGLLLAGRRRHTP